MRALDSAFVVDLLLLQTVNTITITHAMKVVTEYQFPAREVFSMYIEPFVLVSIFTAQLALPNGARRKSQTYRDHRSTKLILKISELSPRLLTSARGSAHYFLHRC